MAIEPVVLPFVLGELMSQVSPAGQCHQSSSRAELPTHQAMNVLISGSAGCLTRAFCWLESLSALLNWECGHLGSFCCSLECCIHASRRKKRYECAVLVQSLQEAERRAGSEPCSSCWALPPVPSTLSLTISMKGQSWEAPI